MKATQQVTDICQLTPAPANSIEVVVMRSSPQRPLCPLQCSKCPFNLLPHPMPPHCCSLLIPSALMHSCPPESLNDVVDDPFCFGPIFFTPNVFC